MKELLKKWLLEVLRVTIPFIGAWAGAATSGCANFGGTGPNVFGFG